MIIPLEPNVQGLAERRFLSFARQILERQMTGDHERITALVEEESVRAPQLRELEGQCDEYTASVRVLGDLAQLRWKLVQSRHGLELHSPRPQAARTSDPCEVLRRKEATRNELRPRVLQQFADPHVRQFIRRLERPKASSRHAPIKALIADGPELQQRLRAARDHPLDDPARSEALCAAVRPYLQLVDRGLRDEHTGIPLRDIWRYFRFTWSIPQTPIPGRSLLYLIRDAAHEHHAVIGIAALSNCSVQMVARDRAIGWSASGLAATLTTCFFHPADQRRIREGQRTSPQHARNLSVAVAAVPGRHRPSTRDQAHGSGTRLRLAPAGDIDGDRGDRTSRAHVTPEDLASPTWETIDRLRHLSREFGARRQEALTRSGDDGDIAS